LKTVPPRRSALPEGTPDPTAHSISEAHRFLGTLWGRKPPGRIQVWRLATRASWYFELPQMVDTLIVEGAGDLYTGACLAPGDLGSFKRCRNDQAAAIAGVWADIDVNGGPEDKTGAAPDMASAMELSSSLLEPTVLVNSGYGLQAWWCFERPWVFGGKPFGDSPTRSEVEGDRARAALIVAQFQKLLREQAGERGYTIDATHDLARLLRLPGTFNCKGGDKAPVTMVACDPQLRYAVAHIKALCAKAGTVDLVAEPDEPDLPVIDIGAVREMGQVQLDALLNNSREFKATWLHARGGNWSLSEYDLALCSLGVGAELNDQQLAGLIALHRKLWGSPEKGKRRDYVRRTIAKARAKTQRGSAIDRLKKTAAEARGAAA
jgi:putative DNA primase/helicase